MELIAHRGRVGDDPENAISSIASALASCSGLEIDVRPSADGVPVLSHDADLRRCFSRPEAISEMGANELASIRAAGRSDGVPSLEDYLGAVAAGHDAPIIVVDIKDESEDTIARLGEATMDSPLRQRIVLAARHAAGLRSARTAHPDASLAWLGTTTKNVHDRLSLAQDLKVDVLVVRHGDDAYLAHRPIVPVIRAAGFAAGASMLSRTNTIDRARADGCRFALVDLPGR